MSVLVVDTSVWVEFFRGGALPELEHGLQHGLVLLAPIVAAELLSAPLSARKREQLADLLADLPACATPFTHWRAVGELRARMARRGVSVSTPDAHVAQCARDVGGRVWSRDLVFVRMAAAHEVAIFRPQP